MSDIRVEKHWLSEYLTLYIRIDNPFFKRAQVPKTRATQTLFSYPEGSKILVNTISSPF